MQFKVTRLKQTTRLDRGWGIHSSACRTGEGSQVKETGKEWPKDWGKKPGNCVAETEDKGGDTGERDQLGQVLLTGEVIEN